MTEGLKFDGAKPRPELLPATQLLDVSRVLAAGAKKYADDNWQHLEGGHRRYMGAALRHIFARMSGERTDPETGLPHLAHAVCSLLFAAWHDDHDTTVP